MYYFKYNETGDIIGVGFSPDGTIVGEGIECTEEQKDNWQLLKIIKGEIVDKYTPEEIAAQVAEQAAALLVSQAKAQIHRDEHLWNNQILWNRYTNEQKTILTNYYDDLIAVTRGESDILPTLTFKGL